MPKLNENLPDVGKLIDEYHFQSEAIIKKAKAADRMVTITEAKKLKELALAAKALEGESSPGTVMYIFVELLEYVNAIDHDFAMKLSDYEKGYLKDKLNVKKG